jgi:hypothetical protein
LEALVRPQAEDTANKEIYGIWGLVSAIVGYALYCVYKDLQLEWPQHLERKRQASEHNADAVEPHSEEGVSKNSETVSQNVKFNDAHPGFLTTKMGDIDSIRDAALNSDATLDEFFSRPIRIASQDWAVNGGLYTKINPWALYWENPRVINRIANYKLLRAKLHLKITINGNAFHYGRIIASYNPLPSDDNMTISRAFIDADVVAASQRPHIYLDPTNSQGGEMVLPFFTYLNVLDVVNQDWQNMGELVLHSMQNLKHANGAADTVTVNVFAWAEEVRFAIPTNFEPGSIAPQADEYDKKPVSRIAGAVARAASYVTDAPIIGPYAKATEMGAKAAGAIATLFGYSSPCELESSIVRVSPLNNIATTNMPSHAGKLTVDAKQELTLDPKTVGLMSDDELTIKYIAQKESFLTNFTWALGSLSETLLWNAVVDPCLHARVGSEIHMPATCFAATPFKYWRGTMKFRFQFVCSKYHKGRVKIVYDPTGTPLSGTSEYNTAYTTIVDISDTPDFEIDVGWGQRNPYREHFKPGVATAASMYDTSALSYTTPGSPLGNGTLAMYVVNELTVPNSTINNDIEVNVFISAGDDFEVAVPEASNFMNLKLTAEGITSAPAAEEIVPHAGEDESPTDESKPENVQTVNTMANSVNIQDETNLVFFGESISSFRQLLKRYSVHSYSPGPQATAGDIVRYDVLYKSFPYYSGYTSDSVNSVVRVLLGGNYAYGQTTFLEYVACAYGGWRGSIRWAADLTRLQSNNRGPARSTVTRLEDGPAASVSDTTISTSAALSAAQAAFVNENGVTAKTFDGQILCTNVVNPIVNWECPYYKNERFVPGKRKAPISSGYTKDTGWSLSVHTTTQAGMSEEGVPLMCAAGEDFSCFFFLGAPIMYYEPTAPSV